MKSTRIPGPSWPCLWLLPLAALLLFGNCGGVRGLLSGQDSARRAQLRGIIETARAQRAAARTQLRGRARRAEVECIELRANARLDSMLPYGSGARKLRHRRGKLEQQLFREPRP